MKNPKNSSIDKKQDFIEEPDAIYKPEHNLIANDSENLHPVLMKLIEQSKAESKAGLGIPHEEVMRRVKLRYPFLK